MKGQSSLSNAIQSWLVQNERGDGKWDAVLLDEIIETSHHASQRQHPSKVDLSHRREGANTLTPLHNRVGMSGKCLIYQGTYRQQEWFAFVSIMACLAMVKLAFEEHQLTAQSREEAG